jgi:RNA polymerase primary sigma factor
VKHAKATAGHLTQPAAGGDVPGADILDLYIEELRRTPVISAQAQKELARRMRNPRVSTGDRARAREELITANLRFAFSVAKKYQNRGLPLDDLISEANAGLCRAADKYDPDVGVNFISYAVWWIKQAILSSITTTGRSVRLPLGRAADVARLGKAQTALRQALNREPTVDEVARVCGLSVEMVQSLSALAYPERSLDEPVSRNGSEDGGATLANFVASEDDDGLPPGFDERARREALWQALEELPPRDRRILALYYGLETGEPLTLEEIGQIFGVSRERVRQLRDRALARVRRGVAASTLRDWAA